MAKINAKTPLTKFLFISIVILMFFLVIEETTRNITVPLYILLFIVLTIFTDKKEPTKDEKIILYLVYGVAVIILLTFLTTVYNAGIIYLILGSFVHLFLTRDI